MFKFLLILIPIFIYAQNLHTKHILILHSYNQSMSWVQDITKAIKDELNDENIVFHIENMDTKRIYNREYLNKLIELYRLKYSNTKFNCIISSDNNAYDFLRENRDNLFAETPVVFCGVNYFKDEDIKDLKNFTGVAEIFDVKSTVELILKLHPNTNNIFIINDYLKTGRAWEKTIKEDVKVFKDRVKFTYNENLTLNGLKSEISNLPKNSIVLLGVYFKDKNNNYVTYEKMGKIITESTTVPTYCLLEFNIQQGIVGGYVISGYSQGQEASKIAKKILNGVDVSSIKVKKEGINRAVFDYRELEKFNISINLLPKDSIIKYEVKTFYKENKIIVLLVLISFLILIIFLIYLILNILRRINAEKKLNELNDNLENKVLMRTKELHRSEQQFKDMFDKHSAIMLLIDQSMEGLIINANLSAKKYYGYENLIGMKINDINTMTKEEVLKEMSIAKKRKNSYFIFKHRLASSEVRNVEVDSTPIHTLDKKVILFSIIHDITDRVKFEKKLKELNQNLEERVKLDIKSKREQDKILIQQTKMAEMGEMVGAIAHQWRQPLNVLGLIVQKVKFLYKRGKLDDLTIDNIQTKAMKQINFMSKTIDDFRDFFKPTKSKEEFFVYQVIEEVISILSAQFKVHNIEVNISEFKGVKILGYKNEFKQVILNILNNSKDAILEREKRENNFFGKIDINILEIKEYIKIEIKDNGGGIELDVIDKVFNPYFTTKTASGTGIGLYMSKMIIENSMKGKIYLSNIDDGAIFSIELKIF